MADATAIIAGILTHDFDDHLIELQEALDRAKNDGVVDVAWSVQLGDLRIDKTDRFGHGMTIGAVMELDALGETLGTVDPVRSEMGRLKILLAHYMAAGGVNAGEAAKKINEQKFAAVKVTEYVERDLPKDGSDLITPAT